MEPQTRAEAIRRLKSIEGHVRGVIRMVEEDCPCPAVLQQTRAIQGSLKQVSLLLLSQHLDHCLRDVWGDKVDASHREVRDELIALFAEKD